MSLGGICYEWREGASGRPLIKKEVAAAVGQPLRRLGQPNGPHRFSTMSEFDYDAFTQQLKAKLQVGKAGCGRTR